MVLWTGTKWLAKKAIKKGSKAIKKRMATRKKMQKKSKPATQKAKAQQATKKHQAKKTEAWGMRKMPGGAYGVPGKTPPKKAVRPPRVRAKAMLKRGKRTSAVSTDLYKSIKGYPTSISKAIGAKHIKAIKGRKATWADKNPKKASAAAYAGLGGAIYASHKAGFDPLAPLTRRANKKRGTQSTKGRIGTKTRSVGMSKAAKKASKKSITQKRYRKVRANQLARKTRY